MSSPALAGVAATKDFVVVADRDPADRVDIFRCLNSDGSERWTLRNPAFGNLDYGNSSRATPLIYGDVVIVSGAQGHVHAVDSVTGTIRWKRQLQRDFGGPTDLPWGYCGSPLIADGRLILQPGGSEAALVAVKPGTGELIWKTAGRPPGHSSAVFAEIARQKQIIAYDNESLGGWDLATGERLWSIKPKRPGDFNVPTPIMDGDRLIVATENNGTRLYRFLATGRIDPEPLAENEDLAPDCESPILVNQRLFGVMEGGLFCLDAGNGLRQLWRSDDGSFRQYASLIGSPDRVLVISLAGKLTLIDASSSAFQKRGELQLFDGEEGLYSHPALVGDRLYVRGSRTLICLKLDR